MSMSKYSFSVLIAAALISGAANAASKDKIFVDDFDTEVIDVNVTNLKNWTVANQGSGASVDVYQDGDHGGLPCVSGACVDLNGTSGVSAHLVSTPITLQPGTYQLSYSLAGSQRGDNNAATVYFNGVQYRKVTMKSGKPFKKFYDVITITDETTASIEFRTKEGDSDCYGLLLDNVTLKRK